MSATGSRPKKSSRKKASSKKASSKKASSKKASSKKASSKKASSNERTSQARAAADDGGIPGLGQPLKDRATGRWRFPGIAPEAYEHPADRAALSAVRAVPGFDTALRALFGTIGDRSLRLAFLGSAVRVSSVQFPRVHRLQHQACRILDIDPVPEVFVAQTPLVNAGAVGVSKPFIVLNSGSLALLEDDELEFVLGHELGHVLSGHVLYKTMLRILMRLTVAAAAIPLGSTALFAITTALLEWDRRSELSADRAGLLVTQDPELAMRVQMKLAGGGQTEQMNLGEFLAQADEYEAGGSVIDSVMKLVNLMGQSHPFPVLRLAELKRWTDSGAFDQLIADGFPLRAGDAQRSVFDEFLGSAENYRRDFDRSRDPLVTYLRELAKQAGAAVGIWEFLRKDKKE